MRRALIFGLFGVAFLVLEGCYYVQAVGGHMELMRKRRPLPEVIADGETEEELKARLLLIQEARQFAVDVLHLPDNGSYTTYSDLERDYVVWNVFAAPEFSLEPKLWCFPVAGCVAYKGFFDKSKAEKFAAKLEGKGYDVAVGGVAAYSTLGRFDDPVLSTMMHWSDLVLVETLFHELAHQRLYVKGDSAFNESFATAVGEIGLERWLSGRGESVDRDTVAALDEINQQLRALLAIYWEQLSAVYESDDDDDLRRETKQNLLDSLAVEAAELASTTDAYNWLAAPLNNARLASIGVYEAEVPSFRILLDRCDGDLTCFYQKAEALADLDYDERQQAIGELGRPVAASTVTGH